MQRILITIRDDKISGTITLGMGLEKETDATDQEVKVARRVIGGLGAVMESIMGAPPTMTATGSDPDSEVIQKIRETYHRKPGGDDAVSQG